ncbi:MAG TPA: hypothetical protein VGC96_12630 [Candidatus Elarobacter sp.]|jgi:hypothetical protein
MNALLALSYADRHAFVNWLRTLRTRPGRLALWALYALAIVGFAVAKVLPRTQPRYAGSFVDAIGDLWVCGFGIVFGVALAAGSSRWLGAFSSRAEALLITRADAPPLLVAAYLQVRAVSSALARGFARFAYLIVIGIPSAASPRALVAQLFFFAAAGAAIASVALPRALARGAVRIAATVFGAAIAITSAIPLALDVARLLRLQLVVPALARAPVLHPGVALDVLAAGDLRLVLIPLAIAAAATLAFVLAARDAYPELFEVSVASQEFRTAFRTPRSAPARARPSRSGAVQSRTGTSLRGAAAFLWIDSLMFTRRIAPTLTGVVTVLAQIGGAAFAVFAERDPELAFGLLIGALPGITIAVASTTGVRLAPALRMPLFWLGSVPMATRLGAWTLGPLVRDLVFVALAIAGYVALSRDIDGAVLVFVGAAGLLGLTRAVGLAVFALLPNQLDQRGPAVMLRTFASFALIAPAVIAATIAVLVLRLPFVAAITIGTACALGESALLIAFAAARLAGHVDRLTTQ